MARQRLARAVHQRGMALNRDIWPEIQRLQGKTLYTLGHNRPFTVVSVDDAQAELRIDTTGGRAVVRRYALEPIWETLLQEKEVLVKEQAERLDIPGSVWTATYVAAMLVHVGRVSYTNRPLRLYLKSKN